MAWWLGSWAFIAMTRVQSLVGALRACKLHDKKRENSIITNSVKSLKMVLIKK